MCNRRYRNEQYRNVIGTDCGYADFEKYKTAYESVSAVMVLQYYNQNISPKTFIDNYLDKGSSNSFDPNVCFGGDPYSETGMGCYAPVITKAVNEYLDRTGVNIAANTVIGKDLD